MNTYFNFTISATHEQKLAMATFIQDVNIGYNYLIASKLEEVRTGHSFTASDMITCLSTATSIDTANAPLMHAVETKVREELMFRGSWTLEAAEEGKAARVSIGTCVESIDVLNGNMNILGIGDLTIEVGENNIFFGAAPTCITYKDVRITQRYDGNLQGVILADVIYPFPTPTEPAVATIELGMRANYVVVNGIPLDVPTAIQGRSTGDMKYSDVALIRTKWIQRVAKDLLSGYTTINITYADSLHSHNHIGMAVYRELCLMLIQYAPCYDVTVVTVVA